MDRMPEKVMNSKEMQDVFAKVMAMGHDPLSKKNGTTIDYIETQHSYTYEFIDPKQFNMKDRAVFITGGSRGLGRAFAVSYAKAGASFIGIGARSSMDEVEKEIQEAAKSAGRAAPKVLKVKLDVTKKDSVAEAAKEVESSFGRLDILVNNSGYMDQSKLMVDVDPDDWWRTFEVNILGTFLVTRAFLPIMIKSENSLKTIANISSMWGLAYYPKGSAYQITKFAQIRFSEFCNSEYGDKGIMAFHVHPGSIETELGGNLAPEIQLYLLDTPEMAADTLTWLTAERREWLAGRFINNRWDMKELLDKKDKIVSEDHLKMRLSVGRD